MNEHPRTEINRLLGVKQTAPTQKVKITYVYIKNSYGYKHSVKISLLKNMFPMLYLLLPSREFQNKNCWECWYGITRTTPHPTPTMVQLKHSYVTQD